MAHLYPSLFTFHLMGVSPGLQAKKQSKSQLKNGQQRLSILPALPASHFQRTTGSPLFSRQKQLLDLIKDLGLLAPDSQVLKNILAYAAGKQKDRDNYDAQGTLSVCN